MNFSSSGTFLPENSLFIFKILVVTTSILKRAVRSSLNTPGSYQRYYTTLFYFVITLVLLDIYAVEKLPFNILHCITFATICIIFCILAKNTENMKTQTSLRLDEELIKVLKSEAQKQRRSLNNLIETILYKVVDIPNEETKQALYEADNNINLTQVENLDKFLEEL